MKLIDKYKDKYQGRMFTLINPPKELKNSIFELGKVDVANYFVEIIWAADYKNLPNHRISRLDLTHVFDCIRDGNWILK